MSVSKFTNIFCKNCHWLTKSEEDYTLILIKTIFISSLVRISRTQAKTRLSSNPQWLYKQHPPHPSIFTFVLNKNKRETNSKHQRVVCSKKVKKMGIIVPVLTLVFLLLTTMSHAAFKPRMILVGGYVGAWKVPDSPSNTLNHWAEANRFKVGDVLGTLHY